MKKNILKRISLFIFFFAVILIATGCSSLLPSVKETTRTYKWNTFDTAKTAFEKITPYKTTTEELQNLGIDPYQTPNLKILTYLDIIQHFMFNPSIKQDELDEGIQACIKAKTQCTAYEINLKNITKKRHGNVLLDLFNFNRKTKESGWEFEALLVMVDSTVVYKLWGGKPIIDADIEIKNPLGPLQNPSDLLMNTIKNSR